MRSSNTVKIMVAWLFRLALWLCVLPMAAQQSQWHYQYISPFGGKEIFEVFGAPFQDKYGIVWLVGPGTAGWFDGYELHPIKPYLAETGEFFGSLINSVFEDEQGNIYAGGPAFLSRMDRNTGQFKVIFNFHDENIAATFLHVSFLNKTLPSTRPFRTVSLNFATESLDPVKVFMPDGKEITSLPDWVHEDLLCLHGRIYTAQAKGPDKVVMLKDTGYSDAVGPAKLKSVLRKDSSGNIWALSTDNRIAIRPRGSSTFVPFEGIPHLRVDSEGEIKPWVFEDRDGLIWITTPNVIYRYSPVSGEYDSIYPKTCDENGVMGNGIYTVNQHKGGEFWAGTVYGATILTEKKSPFAHWNNQLDSLNEMVYAVMEASDGTVWAGSRNSGLYHLSHDFRVLDFYPIKLAGGGSRVGEGVTCLVEDEDGTIWVGTYGLGLYRLKPNQKRLVPVPIDPANPTALPTGKVFRTALKAKNGDIWFARCNGLSIWQKEKQAFKNVFLPGAKDYTECRHIYALAQDKQGRVWVGEGSPYFFRYDPVTENFERFNLNIPYTYVQSILVDETTGNLWIGTLSHGLFLFSPWERKILARYDVQGDDKLGEITAIIPDGKGFFWLATTDGIAKLNVGNKTYKKYKKEDGLGCEDFMTDAFFVSGQSKRIYFGCTDGLVSFQPDSVGPDKQPYDAPLIFTKAIVSGEQRYIALNAKEIVLNPGEVNLELYYSSLDYRYSRQKKYTYYLENLETTWRDTTDQPFAKYTHLRPGSYIFHLRATDSNGFWLSKELTTRVVVQPFWWQSWWFKLGAAIGIAVAIGGIVFHHIKKREEKLRKAAQEALLSARKYQMLPHFVFNSLNAANEFLTEDDIAGANKFLTNFAELMHLHLTDMEQGFIKLSQELHFLNLYLEVQHRRYRDKFDYKISVDEKLKELDPSLPPMLLQPLVENAIQHGLRKLPYKGLLTIEIEPMLQGFCCSVTDNGRGREEARKSDTASFENHHIGMENINVRINLLNQLHKADITFTIIDLKNSANEPIGTKAVMKFSTTFHHADGKR